MLVQYADLQALPFTYGGRYPAALDCFGLLLEVYRRNGVRLPDYYAEAGGRWGRDSDEASDVERLFNLHQEWHLVDHAAEGCVLVISRFGHTADHVGIALDGRWFIHAVEGVGVAVASIRALRWSGRLKGIYEYVGRTQ